MITTAARNRAPIGPSTPRTASTSPWERSPGERSPGGRSPTEPSWDTDTVREIALIAHPTGRQSEAARALRTHILSTERQPGRRPLAVCAAAGGDGCTDVAVNLAVALSQSELKVLLIDANLRQPSVHLYFPAAKGVPGLSDYLCDPEASPSRSVISAGHSLWIMPAGTVCAGGVDLLSGDRLGALLDACQRQFDATIIDTPPANLCSDSRLISSIAGYSLIVARNNSSFVGDVKTLASELRGAGAQVAGSVLS